MTTHEKLLEAALKVLDSFKELGEVALLSDADSSISEPDIAYIAGHVSAMMAASMRLMEAVRNLKHLRDDDEKITWFTHPKSN